VDKDRVCNDDGMYAMVLLVASLDVVLTCCFLGVHRIANMDGGWWMDADI
jgi:hypothetical protein